MTASLSPGFEYLEHSLSNDSSVARPYHCADELKVFKAVRVFDSSWAALNAHNADSVRSLSVMRCISGELIEGMLTELDG